MYLTKTPKIIKPVYSDLIWDIPVDDKTVFLTFDDGPTEFITYQILEILEDYNAKATFFCVGGSIERFPNQFREISEKGHSIGNHTNNHINGWNTNDFTYYKNILTCNYLTRSNLFRPPYGKIKKSQAKTLKSRFKIIMWDVLSADWDKNNSGEQCYQYVIKGTEPGSIIVFHDSLKAEKNMLYSLPKSLEYLTGRGYKFKSIPFQAN